MAIQLTPRIYKPNMKWGLLPKNKIDTVTMRPILNNQDTEEVNSHELTSGTTPGGVSITLPLADNNAAISSAAIMFNTREYGIITESHVMGYASVYLTTIKGSYQVHLSEPPASIPTASWELEGETEYLTPQEKSVQEIYDGCLSVTGTAAFIHSNKSGSEPMQDNASYDTMNRESLRGGLLLNYAQGWAPIFPWIRDTTGEWPGGTITEYNASPYKPRQEDILTRWNPNGDWVPKKVSWNTYNKSDRMIQGPNPIILGSKEYLDDQFIPIVPKKYQFYCRVTKLNSYDYRVDYDLPVRYIYVAGARAVGSGLIHSEQARDTYGYKDVISKITIKLTASTYNIESEDISYGLDSSGQLTTTVSNQHPLSFSENELLTKQAKWSNESWTEVMSEYILNEYKDGKYIIECTVTAQWAIDNAISINSELNVKAQDGTVISRGNTPCLFQVKTIEKSFQGSEFVYNLRLLEV